MDEKKKLLYIVTKSNLGGAQTYVLNLATSLQEIHDVCVAAGLPENETTSQELFDRLNEAGIRTIPLANLGRDISLIKEFRAFFSLLSLYKKEKPDVVHLNSRKAGGLGALAARMMGIKNIMYTAHGWSFYEDVSWYKKIFRRLVSYITILLCHTTIAVSQRDYHAFRRWPFIQNKIIHIYNGISLEVTLNKKEARTKLSIDYNVPESPCMIAAIAELHDNKGLEYAIRAIRNVDSASLVIFGEGEKRKVLEELIEKYDLYYRVHLLGFVPKASQLLSAFDMFVLPSVKEGLPFALLEAGVHGVPVVATNVGGIPDLIQHEKNGLLIESKDPTALASSIQSLCENKEQRERLGEALRQTVENEFSNHHMVEQTRALYR